MDTWRQMQATLEELAAGDLIRRPVTLRSPVGPRVTAAGRELVCLCSNDYLSLACDPAVKAAAVAAVQQWGVGTGASRQVCGSTDLHERLEARLAEFKHAPAAVVTPTGWMANHAAIAALAGAGDLILSDKLNHASIIDAARASGARLRTYAHADVGRLANLLDQCASAISVTASAEVAGMVSAVLCHRPPPGDGARRRLCPGMPAPAFSRRLWFDIGPERVTI